MRLGRRGLRHVPALAMSVFLFAVPARAEVVTLVCSHQDGNFTFDIDIANQTVRTISTPFRPRGSPDTEPARISNRYILFGPTLIQIDRTTGIISWADRSQGNCRRASGDILR